MLIYNSYGRVLCYDSTFSFQRHGLKIIEGHKYLISTSRRGFRIEYEVITLTRNPAQASTIYDAYAVNIISDQGGIIENIVTFDPSNTRTVNENEIIRLQYLGP
jgi:hypothetical protein